jgi:lactoylglutathione lyase
MKKKQMAGIIALLAIIALTGNTTAMAQTTAAANRPHFSHQTIYVVDLQKSSEFYQKVMQLEQIPEPFKDNRHTWFRISEHGQLHVVAGAKAMIAHDINIHLAFSVPSLEAFMKHLDELNIKYGNWQADKKPQARPDKVLQIYLQDPDGYWIEVNNDTF